MCGSAGWRERLSKERGRRAADSDKCEYVRVCLADERVCLAPSGIVGCGYVIVDRGSGGLPGYENSILVTGHKGHRRYHVHW